MTGYLNSAQKHSMTMMLASAQFLDQAIERGDKWIPADVAADLKRGRTFTWRAMTAWLKRLDVKTQRTIVNIIKDHEIGIMTQAQARTERREMDAMLSGREYVHRMAEITMEAKCGACDGGCIDTCPLYESYVHFEVPTYDENHPNCPYSMVSV